VLVKISYPVDLSKLPAAVWSLERKYRAPPAAAAAAIAAIVRFILSIPSSVARPPLGPPPTPPPSLRRPVNGDAGADDEDLG